MAQVSIKEGIRKFGERGVDAVKKEIRQLHEMKALE